MHFRSLVVPALVIAVTAFVGCSGGGKTTAPVFGGGAGGSGGPSFDLRFPAPGSSQQLTFASADTGSWSYHCTPHQSMGMTGTVNVTATAASDTALVTVGVPDNRFSPATVAIKPNGHVRWVNGSTATIHTVTRP